MRPAPRYLPLVAFALLIAVAGIADGGATATTRPWFAAAALALLALVSLTAPSVERPSTGTRLALIGSGGFAAFTALSLLWSDGALSGSAPVQLAAGYFALLAACWLYLRPAERPLRQQLLPALVLSGGAVLAYGLAGRLLPDLVSLPVSARAGGRLTEPVGYWNAMGALGAITAVLSIALAAASNAPRGQRVVGGAVAPMAVLALSLSFSRASIAAAAAGVLALLALSQTKAHARALLLAAIVAGLGALMLLVLSSVRTDAAADSGQGLVAVLLLIAFGAAGSWLALNTDRPGSRPLARPLRLAATSGAIALVLLPVTVGAFGGGDAGTRGFGASAERLTQAGSNRSEYWRVALDAFADRPLAGNGAGTFGALWLKQRTIDESVRNAHSLPLETAAELGLAGLLLLGSLFAGVAVAARRSDELTAVAPAIGGLAAWLTTALVDWQWQVPAVTGVAALLAGLVLATERAPASR